jgi:hypothetical protein
MATYVPNATQSSEPVESRTVESAALEFRTLKEAINTRVGAVESGLAAETAERTANITTLTAVDATFADKLDQIDQALSAVGASDTYANTYRYIVGVTPGTSIGQSVFIGMDLVPDNTEVFYNGVLLYPEIDYTITDTTVTLSAPASMNDSIVIYVYRSVITLVEGGVY